MTLQELIAELAGVTEGAVEDGPRTVHKLFPDTISTRVTYRRFLGNTVEMSQQQVYVRDIGTPQEAAYYELGRVPKVLNAGVPEPEPIATVQEISAAIGGKGQEFVLKGASVFEDYMEVFGLLSDVDAPTEKVSESRWYLARDDKGVLIAKQIA